MSIKAVGRSALLSPLLFATACAGDGPSSGADSGITLARDAPVGERYSAPGPRSCSPKNEPTSGPPSTAQAAAYAICDAEKEWASNLYLVDKLVVTDVAPGRTYEPNQGARYNIDTDQPVYAIRGTMESYQCSPTYGTPTGKNCSITHGRNAEGDCYRTTFGDWRCFMVDARALINETRDQPPPA